MHFSSSFAYKTALIFVLAFTRIWCFGNDQATEVNDADTHLNLAERYLYSDIHKSLSHISKARSSNVNSMDSLSLAKSLYLNGIALVHLGNIDSAIFLQKKAMAINQSINNQKGAILNLYELGIINYNLGQYDLALKKFLKVLSLSQDMDYSHGKALAINYIGKYYHTKGEFNKALSYFENALKIARKTPDKAIIPFIYTNIGKHHETKGNYVQSLHYYLDALKISEDLNNNIILGTTCNHLGNLYLKFGNHDESLSYHQKALKIRTEMGYLEGMGKSSKNIGQIYEDLGQLDSALVNYRKALDYCESVSYKKGITKSLRGIGKILEKKNNHQAALTYYLESLRNAKEMGYVKGIVYAKNNIGNIYNKMGMHQNAVQYLQSSLALASEEKVMEVVKSNYFHLYQIYLNREDYATALHYHEEYLKTKDLLINQEKAKNIAELKVKYEMEKKEKENELLRKENQIQNLQIAQKNRILIMAGIIFLLVFGLMVILYSRFVNKKKANKKLQELNNKVLEQNNQLERLNKKLNAANYEKDKFFSIIAHELRNPLWWFRNLADVLSKNFDKMDRDKLQKAIKSIDESAKNSFHLIDNLLQWSRAQLKRVNYKPQRNELKKLIEENIALIKSVADYRGIKIVCDVNKELYVSVDSELTNTVLRNLISNAIKYTPENGKIFISTRERNGHVIVSVMDSGIGISKKDQKKLFKEDSNFTTLGISHEKGSGLGLLLCKEFVEKNGGKIWVDSELNKGTTFSFTLPKHELVLQN